MWVISVVVDIALRNAYSFVVFAAGAVVMVILQQGAKRFWVKRIDPTLDRISSARRHRHEIDAKLETIAMQFLPNGGKSLIDRVEKLETIQAQLRERTDTMGSTCDLIYDVVRPDEEVTP